MDRLVITVGYYENPHMLVEQQRLLATYAEPVRNLCKLIVVDDGSPWNPAHEVAVEPDGYELEIYRILENRPWGQLQARNLGMHVAPAGSWVLATDIDHTLPYASASALLDFEPQDGCYYTFSRRMPGGSPTNRHANSYLINREWFWDEVGGLNEDYVGFYGTDSIFRARAPLFGKCVALPDVWLVVYNRDGVDIGGIPGAASNLPRKGSKYHLKSNPGMARLARTAHLLRPERPLRFSWERMR